MARKTKTIAEKLNAEYLGAINGRELHRLDAVMHEDFVSHMRIGQLRGREAFKMLILGVYETFPDIFYYIDETLMSENRVMLRYHWESIQSGPFFGLPASHRMVRSDGVEILHIENGLITEIYNYADLMGLAAQCGSPAPLAMAI